MGSRNFSMPCLSCFMNQILFMLKYEKSKRFHLLGNNVRKQFHICDTIEATIPIPLKANACQKKTCFLFDNKNVSHTPKKNETEKKRTERKNKSLFFRLELRLLLNYAWCRCATSTNWS